MALRDKLATRAQPFLEPDEKIEQIFPAQAGSPWMVGLGGGIAMLLFGKPRDVAVTDRAVVVLRQSKLTATPKEVFTRLPRTTQIGPVKGIWAKTHLSGQKLYVHRRFHKDVNSADAAIGISGDAAVELTAEG